MRLRYILRPREIVDRTELQVLSVYRDHGVVPKESRVDNVNKTPQDVTRYQEVRVGDLVVNKMKAWQGSVGVSAHHGIVSPDYLVCAVNLEVVPRFLHYLLRSAPLVAEFGARSKGIRPSQWRLYWEDLAEVRVRLPPLDEQLRIADFLDAESARIAEVVRLRRRQVELITQSAREFVRSRIAGGHAAAAVDSSIPWIGKFDSRAVLVPLRRILLLQRGVDLTDEQRRPGRVPVVTTAGPSGFHNQSIVSGPAVVVGRYGSAGSVHWVEESCWPHNTTLYVKDFKGNFEKYCYYVLKSLPYEMEQARSTVPGINRNDVHKRVMPLLPVDLQEEAVLDIESHSMYADAAISAISASVNVMQMRMQVLITAAVTGQIDVTTARGLDV